MPVITEKLKKIINDLKSKNINVVLLLLAFTIILVNDTYLTEQPFQQQITWDEPSYCAVDREKAKTAIIDSFGTRITVISDSRVIGTVGDNPIYGEDLEKATSLAFGDGEIYVLDHIMYQDRTEIIGDKILKYSTDGKLKRTVYETPEDSSVEISNVYWKDGICYAAGFENEDEPAVVILKISEDNAEEISRYKTNGSDIFRVSYNPETDTSCAVTYDGMVFVFNDMVKRSYECETLQFGDALENDAGDIIAADTNVGKIFILDGNWEKETLAETFAEQLSENGGIISFCDTMANTVTLQNTENNTKETISSAEYTLSHILTRTLTYVCLIAVTLYILFKIIQQIIKIIRKARRTSIEKASGNYSLQEKQTIRMIVKGMAPAFLVTFTVAASLFSIFFWNREIEERRDGIQDLAAGISKVSSLTVGDSIKEINADEDYKGDAYNNVISTLLAICGDPGARFGFDYGFSIYKYLDNTDDIMVIRDEFSDRRLGTVLSRDKQEKTGVSHAVDTARTGEMDISDYYYANGTEMTCATVPLFDSEGSIVGCAELNMDYTAVKRSILRDLMMWES